MQPISLIHKNRVFRGASILIIVFLVIEFLDEVVFSTREAALPLIRDDLHLTYQQVGLFLTLPILFSDVVEPFLFFLAELWNRKKVLVMGGVFFGIGVLGIALTPNYLILVATTMILAPASGMFVGLAQATLMDTAPTRHEQNMARWTLAGSVGVVVGPLLLGGMLWLGGGWRELFAIFGVVSALVTVAAVRTPFPIASEDDDDEAEGQPATLRESLRNAWHAVRYGTALRWLVMLQFADLLMDILLSYLALYMVDVVGVDTRQATFAVAVWTGVGLLGDAALIPLLEKVSGLRYLRFSVLAEMVLFPAFLVVPAYLPKLVILGMLGFFNAGWYAILQGRLYSSMPKQSSTVLALDSISGLAGSTFPLIIGLAAQYFGLQSAMWLMMAAPIVLLIGLRNPDTHQLASIESPHQVE